MRSAPTTNSASVVKKNVPFSPDTVVIESQQQFEESTETEEGETDEAEEDYKDHQNASQASQVPSIPTTAAAVKVPKKRRIDSVNGEQVVDLRNLKNIIRDKLLLVDRYWIQIRNVKLAGSRGYFDQVVIGRDPLPGELAKDGTLQKPFTMGIPLKSLDALLSACAYLTGRDEVKVLSCY